MAESNNYKVFIYILLVLVLIVSLQVIIFQTNIVIKHPGATFATTIRVHEIVENEVGEGYILLERNSNTPSAMDYARINGDTVSYFTIAEGQKVTRDIEVRVPEYLIPGTYYIDYSIHINDKEWTNTKRFRVH